MKNDIIKMVICMNEKELMLGGYLYIASDKELTRMFERKCKFLDEFNNTDYFDFAKRENLIRNIFAHVGKNITINKPFHCDYGCNISVGDNFYMNYDCIFLDVNKITIGNNVFIAPRVSIFTAGHPIDKDIRNELLEYGKEVVIGDDVWIGGNVVINPGVTIGSNVVIGSGSVVTKNIPSGVVAAGNPCKIIRYITDEDKKYWQLEKEKYLLLKDK